MALNALTRRNEPEPPVSDRVAEPAIELVPLRIDEERPAQGRAEEVQQSQLRRFSPLTRRILFVNSVALVLLVFGLLYLDDYRHNLIEARFDALRTQGEIIAAALGEAASDPGAATGEQIEDRLAPDLARQILRRLIEPTKTRARLFLTSGELLADSRMLGRPGGFVQVELLPPPAEPPTMLAAAANWLYDTVVGFLPQSEKLPLYREQPIQRVDDYDEARAALYGETARARRIAPWGETVLSVAVPVQRFKQVIGVLMLSTTGAEIERSIRSVRFDILKVSAMALAVTVLLSLYLAGTIARPIRRLATAAERVRRGHGIGPGRKRNAGVKPVIPDLGRRGDEIGDLSVALNEMTNALWQRLDAIERFAADVAHEIKNPLTSLKSAVETAARVKDPEQQKRLMAIILEDVGRIDRLIGDISGASRLDAELSRAETEPVDIVALLRALVDLHAATAKPGAPRVLLDLADQRPLVVPGLENRLGQVFRNVIANAISFSPADGTIRLAAARRGKVVAVAIDDLGPGIPEDKLEAIFERFYSERPKGEKFGTHSGLGLSISRQIVNAHGGTISAQNRRNRDGLVVGARFIIRLPTE
jgi:two-component system, OmpR family, sensor histidine kinase ChvG